MIYRVLFSKQALKELKKLDKATSSLIIGWINKNLEGCDNPRVHGKSLVSNRTGQWRYRVGDYRILALIHDDIVTILIINVGHRKDIYKSF